MKIKLSKRKHFRCFQPGQYVTIGGKDLYLSNIQMTHDYDGRERLILEFER